MRNITTVSKFRISVTSFPNFLGCFSLCEGKQPVRGKEGRTHSIKFPSGSLQYTLLNLPTAPVRSTTFEPSRICVVEKGDYQQEGTFRYRTNRTDGQKASQLTSIPASFQAPKTSSMGVSVMKHKSPEPGWTRAALGSNSLPER